MGQKQKRKQKVGGQDLNIEIIDMGEVLAMCSCPMSAGSGKTKRSGGTGNGCDFSTIYECVSKIRLQTPPLQREVNVTDEIKDGNSNRAEDALTILARNCADMDTLRSLCLNKYLTNEVKFCQTFTDAIGQIPHVHLIAQRAFSDIIDIVEIYMTKLGTGYKVPGTATPIKATYDVDLVIHYYNVSDTDNTKDYITSMNFSRTGQDTFVHIIREELGPNRVIIPDAEYQGADLQFIDGKWKCDSESNESEANEFNRLFDALSTLGTWKFGSNTVPFFNKMSLDTLSLGYGSENDTQRTQRINLKGGPNTKVLRNNFNKVLGQSKDAIKNSSSKATETVFYRESLQKGRIDAVRNRDLIERRLKEQSIVIEHLLEPWTPLDTINFSNHFEFFQSEDKVRQLQIFFFTCLDLIHILNNYSREKREKVEFILDCIFKDITDGLAKISDELQIATILNKSDDLYFPRIDYVAIIDQCLSAGTKMGGKQNNNAAIS